MFAIEATNSKNWRWIAGVFQHRAAAEAFLQSVPEATQSQHRIVALPLQRYPVFIIEEDGFEYGDVHLVRAKLKRLVPQGDEDHLHLNVYAVREDFAPEEPGIDAMGSLIHWHITDWTLRPPRSLVFDEEISKIAGDT